MKLRGHRVCKSCDTRWSYFETGSISCPDCGSVESVGTGERRLHTDWPASLDLSPLLEQMDERPLWEVADRITDRCRSYIRDRGFIREGRFVELDDRFLVAHEIVHVLNKMEGSRARPASIDLESPEPESMYLVTLLLEAIRGNRPDADSVPDRFRAARCLAYATALDRYRRDAIRWIRTERADDTDGLTALEQLGDHLRRIRAIDGDVPLATGERMIDITRDLGCYLNEADENAIVRARHELDALSG